MSIFGIKSSRLVQSTTLHTLGAVLFVFISPFLIAFNKIGFDLTNIKQPLAFENDEIIYATNALSFFNGNPLYNSNFSAPFGQDLNFAFFSVDSGPTLVAGLLGHLGGNVFFGLNLYYLLTFSFSALSGYFASRLLKANQIFSIAAGLIIALPPFHYVWWTGGLTVTSYFILPILFSLTVMQMQKQLSKRMFFFGLAVSALNGFWYSYYALGYLFLFGTFAIFAFIAGLDLKKIKRILPFALTNFVAFFLVAIPSLIAKHRSVGIDYFGARDAWGAIVNSTTPLHYILPHPGSIEEKIVSFFTNSDPNKTTIHFRTLLNQSGLFNEGWAGTIPWGLMAVTLILSLRYLQFVTLHEFRERRFESKDEVVTIVRILIVISFLWTLIGGFGTIFSIGVSSILRGFARYGIFVIILMSLFCAVALSQKFIQISSKKFTQHILVWLLSLTFLLTPIGLLLNRPALLAGTAASKVEATLYVESKLNAPKGCSILQLPIMHYPYEAPGFPTYRLLRFGLVSDRFNWSAGGVGGSPEFLKLEPLKAKQSLRLSEMIPLAKDLGYCGILVDKSAWKTVLDFSPWPDYDSGLADLSAFIGDRDLGMKIDEIDSIEGSYLWINLENKG